MAPQPSRIALAVPLFALALLVAVGAAVLLARWIGAASPARPLFHRPRELAGPGGGFQIWVPLPALDDARGSVAFSDLELNYAVLVVTGDVAHGGSLEPSAADDRQATLLAASPWETTVPRRRDLLLVVAPDGSRRQFVLPEGGAAWFLSRLPAIDRADLVAELTELLDPATYQTLGEFLAAGRRSTPAPSATAAAASQPAAVGGAEAEALRPTTAE